MGTRKPRVGNSTVRAVRVVASAFGVGAGLLGLEHGYFETRQRAATGDRLVIHATGPPGDPATAWHGCERAFTLIRNYPATGTIAMEASAALLIWSASSVERDGTVLLPLTVVQFLVGGGFTALWFGSWQLQQRQALRNTPSWWHRRIPRGVSRLLAHLWPALPIAYLAWVVASWLLAARASGVLLRLTPVITAVTPAGWS